MLIFTITVVYASVTMINQNNNVTITPGTAIGVATSATQPTTCPVLGSTSYLTVSPSTNLVNWAITAGGSQTQWYCIENQGTGSDASTSINLLEGKPAGITCSETDCLSLSTVPSPIPNLAAQSVSSPIAVTLSAVADASGSGTAVIVVS